VDLQTLGCARDSLLLLVEAARSALSSANAGKELGATSVLLRRQGAILAGRHQHIHRLANQRRLGGDIAVFVTARKLATLIYRLLRWGQPYVDEGAVAYETRYQQQRIGRLAATAKQLGYQLAPIPA